MLRGFSFVAPLGLERMLERLLKIDAAVKQLHKDHPNIEAIIALKSNHRLLAPPNTLALG